MILTIGKGYYPVRDFADASDMYSTARTKKFTRTGGSKFPEGVITDDGKPVARVSLNGCVWAPGPWVPGLVPIYDPRVSA
jgi:hypothetical protein